MKHIEIYIQMYRAFISAFSGEGARKGVTLLGLIRNQLYCNYEYQSGRKISCY